MRLAPLQKLSASMGAALVLVGLFAAVSYFYASRLVATDGAVEQANSNMSAAFRIMVSTQDAERATKAYVVRADTSMRTMLRDAQSTVEDDIDALSRASEDNPHQRQLLAALSAQAAARFDEFRVTMTLRDRVSADSARRFLTRESPRGAADSLMKIVSHMREEELRVLGEHTRVHAANAGSAQRIILIGMIFAFLLAGLALQPMRPRVAKRLTLHLVGDQTVLSAEAADDAGAPGDASAAHLVAIHRLVATLSTARDATSAAHALADSAASTLQSATCAVIVPDGAGGFTVLAASKAGLDTVAPDLARPVADALRTGEPVVAESRAARERLWGPLAVLDTHGARGAILIVPLLRPGASSGVLLAAFAGDHPFGDDELAFASTLGRLGGPAVASRPLIP